MTRKFRPSNFLLYGLLVTLAVAAMSLYLFPRPERELSSPSPSFELRAVTAPPLPTPLDSPPAGPAPNRPVAVASPEKLPYASLHSVISAPSTLLNAANLEEEEGQVEFVAALTATWARSAPIETANFAATLPPGPARREAVVSATSAWARQDPASAARWVSQFPSGPLKEDAIRQLSFAWMQVDTAGAAEWLLTLDDGPERDVALDTCSSAIADIHPDIAQVLAEDIMDDALRRSRQTNLDHRIRFKNND